MRLQHSRFSPLCWLIGLLGASMATPNACAQGFAAYISPPRFEFQMKPGETRREVIEIQHVGTQTGRYRVYTNDWVFRPDNTVLFTDALAPGSCRPWVAVERKEVSVAPNARYRFRYEVTAPADAAQQECRFAIMIEGLDPAKFEQANLNFPVGGRIGVIVYVGVGGAAPVLEVVSVAVQKIRDQLLPVLHVRNSGTSHGRMDGFLNGVDASGQSVEMAPADTPIMPGETRPIPLLPVAEGDKTPPPLNYPITVKGVLEWGKSGRIPLEQRFAP